MTDTLQPAGFVLFAVILVFFVARILMRGIDIFAAPPINPAAFLLAKLCAFASCLFIPLGAAFPSLRWYRVPEPAAWVAAALFATGAVIAVAAMKKLGDDLVFGLPGDGICRLQTGGIFRISRNPLYLGFILIIISSWLYAPHPANIAAGATAAALHHLIVLKEERFLAATRGDEFREYARRTGRYFLIV